MTQAQQGVIDARSNLTRAEAELKAEQKRADLQALREMTTLCRQTRDEYHRLEKEFKEAQAHAGLCQRAYLTAAEALRQAKLEFEAEEFPTDEETAEYERTKLHLEKVLAGALSERQIASAKCAPLQLDALRTAKEYERLQFSHRNLKARAQGDATTGPLGGVVSVG